MNAINTPGALAALTVACGLAVATPTVGQQVVLQSGTLGATGRLGGNSVASGQFVGWRFQIEGPLHVERIGGHLVNGEAGGIFAALVALPALDQYPTGGPFSPDELVAATTFTPPFPSADVRVPLSATLDPGAYVLLFGTGMFGATGSAAIVNSPEQLDLPPTDITSYIYWGIPQLGQPHVWRTNLASNMHLVIEGHTPLTGDFDGDGVVDGADLELWVDGFGTLAGATVSDGDANGDGRTDGADLLAWQQHLHDDASLVVAPEPTGAALAACAAAAVIRRRTRALG